MTPVLTAVVESLEAERLAPVPRASHAVAVDVDDLALILHHAQNAASGPGDVALAFQRLTDVVRAHAVLGTAA